MKLNLKDYVVLQKSFLEKDFCDETIFKIEEEKLKWDKHLWYDKLKKSLISVNDDELDVLNNSKSDNTNIIMEKLYNAILNYIHITNLPWFTSWNGYTGIRYNRYSMNQKMNLHCDHIHTIFDGQRKGIPTLSLLGSLNDNYEGGDLILFDDFKIELEKGDLIIFPSNFLYPHRVEPVISGVRYSYISWVW